MGEYKTPGVYIKEKNAFGNSIVEAETAIPAFIGFTEKALNGDDDLTNVPWKISSMNEFIQYFGGAPKLKIPVKIEVKNEEENEYTLSVSVTNSYTLYWQMQMFFANGGGTCYVVSVGTYEEKGKTDNSHTNPEQEDTAQSDKLTTKMVNDALEALEKEREVTMIVVPEAVFGEQCSNIQQLMMQHCGEMANRFAILDVPQEDKSLQLDKRMEKFQNTVTNYFSYGAAYFPWLNTTVLSEKDLDGNTFEWDESVKTYKDKIGDEAFNKVIETFCNPKESLTLKKNGDVLEEITKYGHTFTKDDKEGEIKKDENDCAIGIITNLKTEADTQTFDVAWNIPITEIPNKTALHLALYNSSPLYKQAIKGILKQLNLLPPSAAMAGIYTMVDHTRGVWKAPANVSLNYVDSPAEDLDDDEQANLNAPMTGKAINVIRMFRGEGVKVWGARTLDGNSLDWRYINVRRTLLFLEESVKNAARAYVFEPNDAGTWINMKSMIENFLRSVWKRGGLAGATPEDAFEVHVGLGDTMTGDDILEGIMRITVLVAVTHPAEFIEITFQQQMQKS